MTTRRGFMGIMLASATAPAIVKSSSLMKLWIPPSQIIVPSARVRTIEEITREALRILEKEIDFDVYGMSNYRFVTNFKKSMNQSTLIFRTQINRYAG